MTVKAQIKVIQVRIEELERQIAPLAQEAARLKHDILRLKSPFQEGDIIQWHSGPTARRGRVVGIREWCAGEPEWRVEVIRNDGSTGRMADVHPYWHPVKVPLRADRSGVQG
jgi:hypothetical protein